MRPIVLNGIDELATRGDLLDRAIILTLPTIPEDRRRSEEELWGKFAEAQPRILGAILDAVSAGVRNLPDVRLERLPRMADLALWVTACEPAFGLAPGAFLAAYSGNRAAAHEVAIEAAAIGGPVLGLMACRDCWDGTARELLAELCTERHSDEKTRKQHGWPQSPRALGSAIRRVAPNLRASGIDVSFYRLPGGRRAKMIRLEKVGAEQSQRSQQSHNPPDSGENADSAGTVGGTVGTVAESDRPEENLFSAPENAVRDRRDRRDDLAPLFSSPVPTGTLDPPDDSDRREREDIMAVEREAEAEALREVLKRMKKAGAI
jgi:hypothetical protein